MERACEQISADDFSPLTWVTIQKLTLHETDASGILQTIL